MRLVKEKHHHHHEGSTNNANAQNKDFAFVEFFSVEDATLALDQAKYEKLKIRGSPVYVSYSKFKRHEQYVTHDINFTIGQYIVWKLFRFFLGNP